MPTQVPADDLLPDVESLPWVRPTDITVEALDTGDRRLTGAATVTDADGADTDGSLAVYRPRFRQSLDDEDAEGFVDAFLPWAELADEPAVLGVVDGGVTEGRPWLVTNRPTRTLRERLDDPADLVRPDEALWLVEQLCGGLSVAHEAGTHHLAIDPGTVVFRDADDGTWPVPMLGGHTRAFERAHPAGVAADRPAYAAPEQLSGGDTDHRTDVYRLGAVCYELLTGQPPVTGDAYQHRQTTLADAAPEPVSERNPSLPGELDDVLGRALAREPADRFESASAFGAALAAVSLPPGVATASRRADDDPDDRAEPVWTAGYGFELGGGPVVAHGTVYGGDADGTLAADRADTGDRRWERDADAPVTGLAAGPGGVWYTTTDALVAVDPLDGAELWRLPCAPEHGPVLADGTVSVVADDTLISVRADIGEERWRHTFETAPPESLAADGNRVYATTFEGTFALDASTGDREWHSDAEDPGTPVPGDGTVALTAESTLRVLDAATGALRWEGDLSETAAGPPAVTGETVYASAGYIGGTVHAFDRESGEAQWAYETEECPATGPVVADETVYVRCEDGTLVACAGGDQHRTLDPGDGRAAPVVDGAFVYVADDRGTVRAFRRVAEDDTDEAVADEAVETLLAVLGEQHHDGELDRDWIPDETGWSAAKADRVVEAARAEGLVDTEDRGGWEVVVLVADADADAEPKEGSGGDGVSQADLEALADTLAAEIDDELDKDWIPDETGWSAAKVDRVVDAAVEAGVVETEEWAGSVDVVLVDHPGETGDAEAGDATGTDEVSEADFEAVERAIEAEPDGELVASMLPMETGFSEAKAEAVVEAMVAAGRLDRREMGDAAFLSVPE